MLLCGNRDSVADEDHIYVELLNIFGYARHLDDERREKLGDEFADNLQGEGVYR